MSVVLFMLMTLRFLKFYTLKNDEKSKKRIKNRHFFNIFA